EHVLRGLEHSAERIARTVTTAAETTPASAGLTALWQRLAAADEDGAADARKRAGGEPHKAALLLLTRRITATRTRNADLAYRDPEDLLAELRTVQDSLAAAGAHRQAYGHLQQLIWQVETFGFHLA